MPTTLKTALKSSTYLLDSSREYSIYVCSTRAIPSIEDGFKHGQRIVLWLLRNRADKLKTYALSGLMGYERLYVHGETSAQNTIGLLAAPYKNNVPLVEGLGQFGSRTAPVEGIGAPRYTEVRRSKAAELLLYRDLDLVPLKDNYDGSNKEPRHFLPLIPLVLLNGVEGVAVGWSTSILPRNPKDLIQATQDALRGKKIKALVPHFERYDIDVVARGPSQWEFFGKCEIADTSTVHISELPPGFNIEKFRLFLIGLEDSGAIVGFTDQSTEVIDISVKFKRGSLAAAPARTEVETINGKKHTTKIPAKPAWKAEDALKFFKLSEKVTERIVVIDWGGNQIRTYESAEKVVEKFAAWRLQWYTKRFDKLFDDTSDEIAYWEVIKTLFEDGFTKRLGTFADRSVMEADIRAAVKKKKKLVLSERNLERVVNLPTYRWTQAFHAEVLDKINALLDDLKRYADILEDPEKLKQVYLDELEELKRKL